jgi:hypothetical protein
MPPKYKMQSNPVFPPILEAMFHYDEYKLNDNPIQNLEEDQQSVKMWNRLFGRVSPEEYAARTLIYATTKTSIPLFSTATKFRIRTMIGLLQNSMLSNGIKDRVIIIYSKYKRTYNAFIRLAQLWKIQHKPLQVTTDLYMNEINPKSPSTYILSNSKGVYYFTLNNLARIISDAITHQQAMFFEPLIAKNPYTNEPFKKVDLFNIYLCMKLGNMRIPRFFEYLFLCEFNIYEFRCRYETELRDNAIKQYVNCTNKTDLYYDVNDMLTACRMTKLICPDRDYPKTKIVDTMLPYLKLYLLDRHSFSSVMREYSGKKLRNMLNTFAMNNPFFGRRRNDDPTKFCEIITHPFRYCSAYYLDTHIYDDNTFERYVLQGDIINTYAGYSTTLYDNNDDEEDDTMTIETESDNATNTPIQQTFPLRHSRFGPFSPENRTNNNEINPLQLNALARTLLTTESEEEEEAIVVSDSDDDEENQRDEYNQREANATEYQEDEEMSDDDINDDGSWS